MKTAREILTATSTYRMNLPMKGNTEEIENAMEEYADQWKYDFSKECKCNDSPGSTWCCNLCGLPITPQRDRDKKILEWMDLNLSAQSKLGASNEVIKQLLSVRSFFENYPK